MKTEHYFYFLNQHVYVGTNEKYFIQIYLARQIIKKKNIKKPYRFCKRYALLT